jgi:hypothetical protein
MGMCGYHHQYRLEDAYFQYWEYIERLASQDE